MTSHQQREISVQERLGNIGAILLTTVQTLLSIPITWRAVRTANWPLKRTLGVSFLRNRANVALRADHLASSPTTGEAIKTACLKRNVAVSSRIVLCGESYPNATIHEIKLPPTDTTAKETVVLYFHGGGYRNTIAGEGHVPFVLECAAAASASKVVFLEYTLTPAGKYPTQLAQAVRALQVLLDDGVQPHQIILGGDSAGGNLALGLLAHLRRPHPSIPSANIEGQLKGVFLISPWVTCPTTASSFSSNASKDYISAHLMEIFLGLWSPQAEDVWADPLQAGLSFWRESPATDKMLFTVGEFEAFRNDVVAQAKIFREAWSEEGVELVVSEGEVHAHPIVDIALGIPGGRTIARVLEWCSAL